jgi:DNA-binding GntR family transcriptional regulator
MNTLTLQHEKVLTAIIEGNEKQAEENMKNHMFSVKRRRVEFLKTCPKLS